MHEGSGVWGRLRRLERPVWRQVETLTHKQPKVCPDPQVDHMDPLDVRNGDRDGTNFGRMLNSPDRLLHDTFSCKAALPTPETRLGRRIDKSQRGELLFLACSPGLALYSTMPSIIRTAHIGFCLNSYPDWKSADRNTACDSLEKATINCPVPRGRIASWIAIASPAEAHGHFFLQAGMYLPHPSLPFLHRVSSSGLVDIK